MFKELRAEKSDNWPLALSRSTAALNQISRPQLGYESSSSVLSNKDDPRIRLAKEKYATMLTVKERAKLFPYKASWQQMERNSEIAQTIGTKYEPGDFVLLDDLKKSKLAKSYQVQRSQIFLISSVMYSKRPLMYELKDLKGDNKGNFYQSQLRKSALDPRQKDYWVVEKVTGQKKIDNQMHYNCRFQYYPNKFNKYLKASEIDPKLLKQYKQDRRGRIVKK